MYSADAGAPIGCAAQLQQQQRRALRQALPGSDVTAAFLWRCHCLGEKEYTQCSVDCRFCAPQLASSSIFREAPKSASLMRPELATSRLAPCSDK